MRREFSPGCITSSANAKIPGWFGTSSRLKLDSHRNQRDQFISIFFLQRQANIARGLSDAVTPV
jgi:hypothetical protein